MSNGYKLYLFTTAVYARDGLEPCAPFCDRVVSIPQSRYLPSRNRGIPVPKQPTTIGGHLRKRRLQLQIHQSEAAAKLKVSTVTSAAGNVIKSIRLGSTIPG